MSTTQLMGIDDILLLGDPRLYQKSAPVEKSDLPYIQIWVDHLANAMKEIREKYHFGRGIAAPQLGIMKQLVYIQVNEPMIIINPKLTFPTEESTEMWDDCMSFPNLLVKVRRFNELIIKFLDEKLNPRTLRVTDFALSELIQHEVDHLEGILCTMRAVDTEAFRWRPTPAG